MLIVDSTVIHKIVVETCREVASPLSNWYDWFSLIASVVTIICFIITCFQIKNVKKKTSQINEAVNKKIKQVNVFLSYANVEKYIQLSSSVHISLKEKQYEAAVMKLEELKRILLEMETDGNLKETDKHEIGKLVMNVSIDIEAIRTKWTQNLSYDNDVVTRHIGEITTMLYKISRILKQQGI